MNRIQELKDEITVLDTAYRNGNPIVSDEIYDNLVEELEILVGEDDEFFNSSIKEETFSIARKSKIPLIMASMHKLKSMDDVRKWIRLKNIPEDSEFIVLPKFDGASLSKDEKNKKAWTRGSRDNEYGLSCDEHIKYINDTSVDCPFTFGEAIISRENFDLISDNFESNAARNACSGLLRRDDVTEDLLEYVDFIKFGVVGKDFDTKKEMIDFLNSFQNNKVEYRVFKLSDMNEDILRELYFEFSKKYELDGLIIEVNDTKLWNKLGRERNLNPCGSRAYKCQFEIRKMTKVIDIENGISKIGNIIPVAIMEPVEIDGVVVSRATLNNYSYMIKMGIGPNSVVEIIRSGGVIPKILRVLNKEEILYPEYETVWDVNGVHLKTVYETDEQKQKAILSFFRTLKVEFVSEKTIELLWVSGFSTIKDILKMSKEDFRNLERFGEKKAEQVYNAIHSKMKDVTLSRLQHASGCFNGLGSKKLVLLEKFKSKPSIEEIMMIDGFSNISSEIYLNGYDKFFNEFIIDLPITLKETKTVEILNNFLKGCGFVFTGFRNKEIEGVIESYGGKILSSVSSNTTYLVMKEKGSGTTKEAKALSLGVTILNPEELGELLNSLN